MITQEERRKAAEKRPSFYVLFFRLRARCAPPLFLRDFFPGRAACKNTPRGVYLQRRQPRNREGRKEEWIVKKSMTSM